MTINLEELFDRELLARLRSQATTIVERLVLPRNYSITGDVFFPRGTNEFALIHRMVTNRELLVALLDEAAQDLVRREGGPEWRISTSDPLVSRTGDWVTVMVHLDGAQITDLAEVPDDLRIFSIDNTAPYRIRLVNPSTPAQIAYARKHDGLKMQRERHRDDRARFGAALVALARAALAAQQDTLPKQVVDAVNDLLAESVGSPHGRDVGSAFAACSYLGLTDELFATLSASTSAPDAG